MKEKLYLKIAIGLCLLWLVAVTAALLFVMDIEQGKDRIDHFQGRYLNMSIEGLSVLQQQLSKTNVRLSAVESEIEKGKKAPEQIGEGETSFIQRRCKEGK